VFVCLQSLYSTNIIINSVFEQFVESVIWGIFCVFNMFYHEFLESIDNNNNLTENVIMLTETGTQVYMLYDKIVNSWSEIFVVSRCILE